jgi:hypothetical protein
MHAASMEITYKYLILLIFLSAFTTSLCALSASSRRAGQTLYEKSSKSQAATKPKKSPRCAGFF